VNQRGCPGLHRPADESDERSSLARYNDPTTDLNLRSVTPSTGGASHDRRTQPRRPFTGDERELLENTLELNRAEIVTAVEGLSDAQARQKRVPSLTTPISLIKHCAAAERIWFQRTLAGMRVEDCDGHAIGGDSSFFVADDETLADVIAEYAATCEKSREIAAVHSLDDTAEHHLVGRVDLRFIYLVMIGDIARHAGHADILVEQIRAKTRQQGA